MISTPVQTGTDGFTRTGEYRRPRQGEFFLDAPSTRVGLANEDFQHEAAHILVEDSAPTVSVERAEFFAVNIDGHTFDLDKPEAYALFRALDRVLD